jgi:hypothetical protein
MASVLEFLLNVLRKLPCKLRGFFPGCLNFKSWVLFLAFLGRKFGLWRPVNKGKGTFKRAEQAEHSFPGTGAPCVARLDVNVRRDDHAIACSSIPSSARHPAHPPVPANLTARPQHDRPHDYPPSMHSNRSCASIQSRASERLSIIQSRSYESLNSSLAIGNPKAAHRQFGCGPSTDHLEGSSHPRASPSLIGIHGLHRAESLTSVVVVHPSTESLPHSPLADSPTLQEEPYSIGSPTVHSSPDFKHPNLPGEPLQLTLPDGRVLQMIISEQVPRYTKSITVQVNIIITPSISYVLRQTPREEEL